ncbi:hypothetical protein [Veronia pacifica]|uniref:DUF1127 domain-containing protein n=1 Tax=Veronia pacifica TaxID=1080227 RepID=A0A1C3EGY5_9GAMM|nr:hypothetical protein [Veronia pacifica]ODA32474.1 hypothetical protein A8L45_12840 [Veronia pacifica]
MNESILTRLATLLLKWDIELEILAKKKALHMTSQERMAMPASILKDIGFDDEGFCHRPDESTKIKAKRHADDIRLTLLLKTAS